MMRNRSWLAGLASKIFPRRFAAARRASRRRPTHSLRSFSDAPLASETLEPRHLLSGVSLVSVDTLEQGNEADGSPTIFQFTRTGDTTQSLDANVILQGTALPDVDYTAPAGLGVNNTLTVTFDAGSDTASVSLATLADAAVDPYEAILAIVQPGSGYAQSVADYRALAHIAAEGVEVALEGNTIDVDAYGNGSSEQLNERAFAALTDDGSIRAWGVDSYGGTFTPQASGYTSIASTSRAFAALNADGTITCWGDSSYGGIGAPTETGFTEIFGNTSAFAALNSDGSIHTWGSSTYGGTGGPSGSGYEMIVATDTAFAALKSDGSIAAWGNSSAGGYGAPTDAGYVEIVSNGSAFAARKADGSITSWGNSDYGGSGAPTGSGYTQIAATSQAFAALAANGSITSWGSSNHGGTGAPASTGHTEIFSNDYAFAAIQDDGAISTWGDGSYGGSGGPSGTGFYSITSNNNGFAALREGGWVSAWGDYYDTTYGQPSGSGYTQIAATNDAFAALNAAGGIYAWGSTSNGGYGEPTDSGYVEIIANNSAFVAIKNDGSITSWGNENAGGEDGSNPLAPGDSGYTQVFSNDAAFAALKSDGSVTSWGNNGYGGTLTPSANGHTQIYSNPYAFAAIQDDGAISTWGDGSYGGSGGPSGTGFYSITSNNNGFAALRDGGWVSAWGDYYDTTYGQPSGSGYTQIAATNDAFAALNAAGGIYAWGSTSNGGYGEPTDSGYVEIIANNSAFVARKADGSLTSWGNENAGGEDGSNPLAPGDSGYTQVFSNDAAFAALKSDGSVTSWGNNGYGGTLTPSANGHTQIYSNPYAFAAIQDDGAISTWGDGSYGGSGGPSGTGFYSITSNNNGFAALRDGGWVSAWGDYYDTTYGQPSGSGYTQIAATNDAFAALNAAGGIYAWGSTSNGGYGEPTDSGYVEIIANNSAFVAIKNDGSITSWGNENAGGEDGSNPLAPGDSGYTQVFSNDAAFAALKSDGSVTSWGNNGYGGTLTPSANGHTQIYSNPYAFAAIQDDGAISTWGDGSYGGSGGPSGTGFYSITSNNNGFAALRDGGWVSAWGDYYDTTYGQPSGSGYTQIAATNDAFAALNAAGGIYAWGSTSNGGYGEPTDSGYVEIIANNSAFVARKADGSLTSWGNENAGGEDGSNPLAPGDSGYTQVFSNDAAFAALKSDGSVTCWGNSGYGGTGGQTGLNNTTITSTSRAFAALKDDGTLTSWGDSGYGGSGAPTDTYYTQIYANESAFAALKDSGAISSWGNSAAGGTGAPSGTGFAKIVSTDSAFAALKDDGSIHTWGSSTYGGTGGPSGNGFTDIFSNGSAFAALAADGSIVTWGYGAYGGSDAPEGTGYTQVVGTDQAFAALTSDGSLRAWGVDSYGGTPTPEDGFGHVYSTSRAFAALNAQGEIFTWGDAAYGGTGGPTGGGFTQVFSTSAAFAALATDGSVTTWGSSSQGGTGGPSGTGFLNIISNGDAFAALHADGSIVSWGDSSAGGSGAPTDTGYTDIFFNGSAFAALAADGSITTWGYGAYGGSDAPEGTGYTQVVGTDQAFAALTSDGSLRAWGVDSYGGTPTPEDGFGHVYATSRAFAALNAQGEIFTWGDAAYGGTGGPTGGGFTQVFSTSAAFATLAADGSITTWGSSSQGGTGGPSGTGFLHIISNGNAFAALHTDGSIVSWGDSSAGGSGAPTDTGYVHLFANGSAFTALKQDGTLTSWGNSAYGGSGEPTEGGFVAMVSPATDDVLATVPVFADQTFAMAENSAADTLIGTLVATDPQGAVVTLTLTGNADPDNDGNDAVRLTGDQLFINDAGDFNFENELQLTLTAVASDGTASSTATITVGVTNVNEAPTITSPDVATVAENYVYVATVTASDPDAGDTIDYAITGGVDSSAFSLDPASGVLTFLSAPDFETPGSSAGSNTYEVEVTATDSGGLTAEQTLAVTVTDANEAPVILDQTFTVDENSAGGTVIGTLEATDPDGDVLTYSITSTLSYHEIIDDSEGAPGFIPSAASGWITQSPKPLAYLENTHKLKIINQVSGTQAEWNFSNLPNGQYKVYTTWWYTASRCTAAYTIGWGDFGNSSGGVLASKEVDQIQAPAGFTDGDGWDWEELGTVNVEHGELKVRLEDGIGPPSRNLMADAVRIESISLVNSGPDPDGDGNTAFRIEGDQLVVNDSDDFDFETNPQLVITAEASDGTLIDTAQVTVNLTNVDEVPVITLLGDSPLTLEASNTANYSDPGATASDPEDGDITGSVAVSGQVVDLSVPDTYVIDYNVQDSFGNQADEVSRTVTVQDTLAPVITLLGDPAPFIEIGTSYSEPGVSAVDSFEGDISASVLVSGDTVDTSTVGTYTIIYDVSDSSGNDAETVSRTVSVTPPNTPPVVTDQSFSVAENSAEGTSVGIILASDSEGHPLSYSIATNTDPNANGIDAFRLEGNELIVADPSDFDHETAAALTLTVAVTDIALTTNAVITVNVTNVNEAPNNTVPGNQTVNEDTNLTFSGANAISVGDVDSGSADVQVALSVSSGTLTLSGTAGLTFAAGANGTAAMTITGPTNAINAALEGMIYRGDLDFNGTDVLTIETNDLGNTGSGGPLSSGPDTVTITVNPVNDAPVISEQSFTVPENSVAGTVIGTLTATDVDGTTATFNYLNFFTDFESGLPAEFSGDSNSIEPVDDYAQVGDFSGSFLRNISTGNPAAATTVTFTDLAPHEYVNLEFLLAIIDSWNGNESDDGPDYFNVSIDGVSIFSETFENITGVQSYQPPAGVHLGSGDYWFDHSSTDAAYDMGLDPTFAQIPHTSGTLAVSWYASGSNWSGGTNESWAIENLSITTSSDPIAFALASPADFDGDGNDAFRIEGDGLLVNDPDDLDFEGTNPIIVAVSASDGEDSSSADVTVNLTDVADTLGSISGTFWHDLNGDGERGGNELALAGWTAYIDANLNGALDAGEVTTTSDTNGDYSFAGLDAGTYVIGQVLQSNWNQTYPGSASAGNSALRTDSLIDRQPPTASSSVVEGAPFTDNEIIVKLTASLTASELSGLRALQASRGAATITATQNLGIELWSVTEDVESAIPLWADDPRLEYVQPNYLVEATLGEPDDTSYDSLWGLHNTGQTGGTIDADIDAPEAWEIQTGTDIVIGIIDTGIDYTHPDLVDNIWTNPGEIAGNGIDDDGNGYVDDVYGYDFMYEDSNPMDYWGHGTHVAGTVAARGDNGQGVVGVNWSAKLMPIKIFSDSYGEGSATSFNIALAIEYATMMGARVTNNSWGGDSQSSAIYDAIAAAQDAGVLFVAAAGNDGDDNDVENNYPSNYELDNIIAVAATDHNDQLALLPSGNTSNFGANTVHLGAPGKDVYSTKPSGSYQTKSGTSMAAPHVAGVAALILAENPTLTAAQVKQIILDSVDPIPALDGITITGGRLNAHTALLMAQIYGTSHTVTLDWAEDVTDIDFGNKFVIDPNGTIIDDGEGAPGFIPSSSSGWITQSSKPLAYLENTHKLKIINQVSGTQAEWVFSDLPNGQYKVATTWWYTPSRATAPYTIGWGDFGNSSGGVLATKECDQTQAPDDFTDGDGWTWEELGTVNVEHGELKVRLEDGIGHESKNLMADAMRIERISDFSDEAPVFNDQSFSVDENSAADTLVGTLVATDADGDAITYSIISNVDPDADGNAAFRIEGDGLLVNDADDFDYEANSQLVITAEASDGSLSDTAQITVNVTDVNEAPVFDNQAFAASTYNTLNDLVGILSGSDPEGQSLTYALTSNNDSDGDGTAAFRLEGDQLLVNDVDDLVNADSPITLTAQASDGSLITPATLTVSVYDSPLVIEDLVFEVSDQATEGDVVGTLSTLFPYPTSPSDVTFLINTQVDAAGNVTDALRLEGNQLLVNDPDELDSQQRSVISIGYLASDVTVSPSVFWFKRITVHVYDGLANGGAPPQVTEHTAAILDSAENTDLAYQFGTASGDVSYSLTTTVDPDGDGTPTFAIDQNKIVLQDGDELSMALGHAFPEIADWMFYVGNGNFTEVNRLDRAANFWGTVNENSLDRYAMRVCQRDLVFSRLPGGNIHMQVGGPPEYSVPYPLLSIRNGDGEVMYSAVASAIETLLQFDPQPLAPYVLKVADSAGNYHQVTVEVNRPPVFEDHVFAIDANAAEDTVVGSLSASDADGDAVTFSVSDADYDGDGTAAFRVEGGQLVVNDAGDLEAWGASGGDADQDGVPDRVDNAPITHNPDQEDTDGDGIGDAADVEFVSSWGYNLGGEEYAASAAIDNIIFQAGLSANPDAGRQTNTTVASGTGDDGLFNELRFSDSDPLNLQIPVPTVGAEYQVTFYVAHPVSYDKGKQDIALEGVTAISAWDTGPRIDAADYGTDDPRPLIQTANVVVNDGALDVQITPTAGWYAQYDYVMLSAIRIDELQSVAQVTGIQLAATASDGKHFDSAQIAVQLNPVGNSPVFDDQSFSVAENSAADTLIGTLVATDADGDPLSYSISTSVDPDGDGNDAFRIEGDQLLVNDAGDLDFEANPQLVITAEVSDGTLADTAQIIVNITDVDDTIVFDNQAFSLPENSAEGTVVGTFSDGSGLEVLVVPPVVTGSFALAPNYKSADAHNGDMYWTNNGSDGSTATFAAEIDEPGEYRVYLWWSGAWDRSDNVRVSIQHADGEDQVTVNQAAHTGEYWQYELGSYDFDTAGSVVLVNNGSNASYMNYAIADAVKFELVNQGFIYSIVNNVDPDGDGNDAFRIEGDQLLVNDAGDLDFEANPQLVITAEVSDGSLTDTATVTISLSDVNEAPTGVALANAVSSLPEVADTTGATKVADIVITDDALGTNAISLTGADAGSFEVVGTELFLAAGTALDYETQASYDVTVSVEDSSVAGSTPVTVNHTLAISDVNEAPTGVTLTNAVTSLLEDTDTTSAIKLADIVITDDALGTNAISLSGTDAASFEVVGTELFLVAGTALDYEAQSSYAVTVRVEDSSVAGSTPVTVNYTLAITAANAAPVFADQAFTLAENSSEGTAVGTLAATDPDGDPLSYSIAAGTDPDGDGTAAFRIEGDQLVVNDPGDLDYETGPQLIVTAQASDGSLSDTAQISVNLTNVNDAPEFSYPDPQSVAEDTDLVFSAAGGNPLGLSDADAEDGEVGMRIDANYGLLTLPDTTGLTFLFGSINGSHSLSVLGTIADINTALDGLIYSPLADYHGADTLSLTAHDLGHSGPGGNQMSVATVEIAINPVNDAPQISVPPDQTTPFNTTLFFSAANDNAIQAEDVDAGTEEIGLLLSLTSGTFSLAQTTGLTLYSGSDNSSLIMCTGTLANINAALEGLSYTPSLDVAGDATLTILLNDLGNSGSGNDLSDTKTVVITAETGTYVPVTIIDSSEGAPGFIPSASSGWITQSSKPLAYLENTHKLKIINQVSGTQAEWVFSDLPNGQYKVATTWWHTPSRATAPYTIGWGDFGNSSGGVLATKECDQTQAPDDFTDGDGWTWEELGTVNVEHGELKVRLEDGIGPWYKNLIADAVRIEKLGSITPTLTVAIAADSVSEAAGTAATTATVTRTDTSGDLVVSLASDDVSEATAPSSVTILDGQSSASFEIAAIDDSAADGTQTVTFSATATGYAAGSDTLEVTDDEFSAVTIIDSSEGAPGFIPSSSSGWITQSSKPLAYLENTHKLKIINQVSGTQAEWSFTDLPNGQYKVATTWWHTPSRATAPYTIGWGDFGNSSGGVLATKECDQTQAPDDFTDGDGWTWEELGTVNVEHGELKVRLEDGIGHWSRNLIADAVRIEKLGSVTPALTVAIAADSVAETAGTAATTATVTRTDTSGDLVVSLASDDVSEATALSSVTILDGQSSASFNIAAIDDSAADGTQTVTFSATATGYTTGSDTLEVTDDESALVTIIDNGEIGFTQTGFSYQNNSLVAAAYGGDNHTMWNGTGEATWTFSGLENGEYQVTATWAHKYGNRYNAPAAPFAIQDSSGAVLASVTVDQRNSPSQFDYQGYSWDALGTVSVADGTLVVTLGADAQSNTYSVADAVRIERLLPSARAAETSATPRVSFTTELGGSFGGSTTLSESHSESDEEFVGTRILASGPANLNAARTAYDTGTRELADRAAQAADAALIEDPLEEVFDELAADWQQTLDGDDADDPFMGL